VYDSIGMLARQSYLRKIQIAVNRSAGVNREARKGESAKTGPKRPCHQRGLRRHLARCLADESGAALPQAPQLNHSKRLPTLAAGTVCWTVVCCADHVSQQSSLYTSVLRRLQHFEKPEGGVVCPIGCL
jgi:hypothetical protein